MDLDFKLLTILILELREAIIGQFMLPLGLIYSRKIERIIKVSLFNSHIDRKAKLGRSNIQKYDIYLRNCVIILLKLA